ncbi:ribosomal RNA large subunit methyltransferase H [Deltaproteobacteria bacterium]|nr:ribosomal RNA large subunit methyltransferase H [Deltaproteobacteria bacterium]
MQKMRIISVGTLREAHWKSAANVYAHRLKHAYQLEEIIVKDADASLPRDMRVHNEGERILKAMKDTMMPICLDEHGEMLSSVAFADFLRRLFDAAASPCFIIGGAYGLSDAVQKRARALLSLGPMTLPHELARVLLLEQLYRADAIMRNRPYHHE